MKGRKGKSTFCEKRTPYRQAPSRESWVLGSGVLGFLVGGVEEAVGGEGEVGGGLGDLVGGEGEGEREESWVSV